MPSSVKPSQPLDCYIVLWSNSALSLVYRPGEPPHWVGPGDPGPEALMNALATAHALAEVGAKTPSVRKECMALADKLTAAHEVELRRFCESRVPVHA